MEALPAFEVRRPQTIRAAVDLLAMPGARVIAGGTDLLPNLRRGIERPPVLVELGRVEGLDAIDFQTNALCIGAGVSLARLASDARIAAEWAAIADASRAVAAPQHRNAATVGGNLCADTRCVFYNQSEWWRASNGWCLKRKGETCHVAPQGNRCHAAYSGDLAPALIALGGEAELVASSGVRRIPLAELYRDDGAAHLALQPGELLTCVRMPRPAAPRSGYRKARVRGSMDFPLAGVAVALWMDATRIAALRVALTGTNSHPLVLADTDALVDRRVDAGTLAAVGKLVARQVSPMRTTATASNYRRQVASVLAQRLLAELAS